jgi:hypothetical protein
VENISVTKGSDFIYKELLSMIGQMRGFNLDENNTTKKLIVVKATASLKSWGENLTIEFLSRDDDVDVIIKSSPKYIFTVIDGGKNKKNVDVFMREIKHLRDTSDQ